MLVKAERFCKKGTADLSLNSTDTFHICGQLLLKSVSRVSSARCLSKLRGFVREQLVCLLPVSARTQLTLVQRSSSMISMMASMMMTMLSVADGDADLFSGVCT